MLLSPWFISNNNPGLTADALHFVLKNALSLDGDELRAIKWRAHIPLMELDSTYDDLPLEVLGAFVMEPYFPRKHFNRAFAWLFGKESIGEIDAESFSCHDQIRRQHACYSLSENLAELQFTKEEYDHLYGEFSKLIGVRTDRYFNAFKEGLVRHHHLSAEAYMGSRRMQSDSYFPSFGVCTEIANHKFDQCLRNFNFDCEHEGLTTGESRAHKLMEAMELTLTLDNLGMDKRREVHAMIGPQHLGLEWLIDIYNNEIPDDVFEAELAHGVINKVEIDKVPGILSDIRIPREMATAIVFSTPASLANYAVPYFNRKDIGSTERKRLLLGLLEAQNDNAVRGRDKDLAKKAMASLLTNGLLTLPEVEFMHDKHQDPYRMRDLVFQWMNASGVELPPAIQDRWTQHDFCSAVQLLHYHDIPTLVETMRGHYFDEPDKPEQKALAVATPHIALFNTRWTRELLLELIDITRQAPYRPEQQERENLDMLRKEAFNKLFSESFYLSLDRDDLTGRYGRAENLLARLLDGDAHRLSEFDINLIIHSRLQFDYADDEVDLAASLACHPELNNRIVAGRLSLRLEQSGDTPALAPTRLHRAL
jgi:hypothetical protein